MFEFSSTIKSQQWTDLKLLKKMRLSQNIRRSVFTGPFSINQTIQKASKVFLCCLPVVAGYYVVCTKCRPCGYLWRNFLMFYYHEFIVIITVDFYFVADFGLQ